MSNLLNSLQNTLRGQQLSTSLGDRPHRAGGEPFHLTHHLTLITFGYDQRFGAQGLDPLRGEGPDGDQSQQPHLQAPLAGQTTGQECRASGRAVSDHYDAGSLQVALLAFDDLCAILKNLAPQATDQTLLRLDIDRRITLLVMGQPGDVNRKTFAGTGHRWHQCSGAVGPISSIRSPAPGPLDLFFSGDEHVLDHLGHDLIGHDQHRGPEFFGHVKRFEGQIKHLLRRLRGISDELIITMRAPLGLHHIGLRGQRGQTGGRSAALNVNDHAGGLGHHRQAQVLLHQAEAGTGGGRHHLTVAPTGSQDGRQTTWLILHLQIVTAHLRQPPGHAFGDLA